MALETVDFLIAVNGFCVGFGVASVLFHWQTVRLTNRVLDLLTFLESMQK